MRKQTHTFADVLRLSWESLLFADKLETFHEALILCKHTEVLSNVAHEAKRHKMGS